MNPVLKILLADDDAEDRFIFADSFKTIGKAPKIYTAEDGQEALDFLSKFTQEELPSLIVLDLNMPKMNGTETLRALKGDERLRSVPVIIYSTSVNEIEKEICLSIGAASYVTKPATYTAALEVADYFYDFALRYHSGS